MSGRFARLAQAFPFRFCDIPNNRHFRFAILASIDYTCDRALGAFVSFFHPERLRRPTGRKPRLSGRYGGRCNPPRHAPEHPPQQVPQVVGYRDRTIAFVEKTQDDPRSRSIEHPLLKQLDAYQWILLLSAHSERHTAQIEELKAAPVFPSS